MVDAASRPRWSDDEVCRVSRLLNFAGGADFQDICLGAFYMPDDSWELDLMRIIANLGSIGRC